MDSPIRRSMATSIRTIRGSSSTHCVSWCSGLPLVRRRWSAEVWGLLLGAVVMLDLYSVERRYLPFSPRAAVEMAPDEVVAALKRDTSLYRVLPNHTAYTHNYLMVHGIRSVVGY